MTPQNIDHHIDHRIDRRRALRRLAGAAAAGAAAHPLHALAQEPAALPMARIVVGSGAGSVIDILARRTAERLKPGYAQNVIVENRTGAAGQLAVSFVKTAPADGGTLLLTPSPHMVLFPHTYQNLPYNPGTDLLPVSMGASLDLAFAVGPAVPDPVKGLKDFVQWCKAHPAQAQFGSPAAGSTPHFAGAMLARAGGFSLDHVPYRGPTPAVQDMVGGQVAAACAPLGDIQTFAKAGKCRILGVASARRSPFAPEVATFAEQGFTDVVIQDWVGFFLPAGVPAAQVQQAQAALAKVLAAQDLREAMATSGYEVRTSSPGELAERMRAESERWKGIVKSLGFTAMS